MPDRFRENPPKVFTAHRGVGGCGPGQSYQPLHEGRCSDFRDRRTPTQTATPTRTPNHPPHSLSATPWWLLRPASRPPVGYGDSARV